MIKEKNMNKKDAFIEFIKNSNIFETAEDKDNEVYKNAKFYFDALQGSTGNSTKLKFTDIGRRVIVFMRENKDKYNNLFTAKGISEELNIASRSISGGCRKLVNDGYLEKIGDSPVTYSLTEAGETTELDNSEII